MTHSGCALFLLRPRNRAAVRIVVFLGASLAGIGEHGRLLAVQQVFGLDEIGNVRGDAGHGLHHPRISVHADVRRHPDVPWVASAGGVHSPPERQPHGRVRDQLASQVNTNTVARLSGRAFAVASSAKASHCCTKDIRNIRSKPTAGARVAERC